MSKTENDKRQSTLMTLNNTVYVNAASDVLRSDLCFYNLDKIQNILGITLQVMSKKMQAGLVAPYFAKLDVATWQRASKTLDIYVTNMQEAGALNLDARGKHYATNILSYPSDLPLTVLTQMDEIPLGELVICHAVLGKEAMEQNKPVADHLAHLLVHGILHLLGFDHELGQAQQNEMEGFEIEILDQLGIADPY